MCFEKIYLGTKEFLKIYKGAVKIWPPIPSWTFQIEVPDEEDKEYGIHFDNPNVTVYWGDGDSSSLEDAGTEEPLIHTYTEAGTYDVKIEGTADRITFEEVRDWDTWQEVGNPTWLVDILTAIPVSMGLTSARRMFVGCTNFNPTTCPEFLDAASINVTNMSNMFRNATAFNADISGWDVSNVTTMSEIFLNAAAFNQDISGWNTSNVAYMNWVFWDTAAFNQDIGGWDVSNVTSMAGMFWNAAAFNADISEWDVSNVTNMNGMFNGASAFNIDISGWNTSNVTNMNHMFRDATAFNQDISGWNTSKVENWTRIFKDATSLVTLGSMDYSGITDASALRDIIQGATSFSKASLIAHLTALPVLSTISSDDTTGRLTYQGVTSAQWDTLSAEEKAIATDKGWLTTGL